MIGVEQLTISLNQLFGWSIAISGTVALAICALWSIWLNRIKEGQKAEFQQQIEKQKAEFSKEIEDLKAKNENKTYITKTQFDAEFKIYQELSADSFNIIQVIKRFDPTINKKATPYYGDATDFLKEIRNNIYKLNESINKYAPFIKKDKYDLLKELNKYFYDNFIFIEKTSIEEGRTKIVEVENIINNYQDIIENIICMHDKFINNLREYLDSLKVKED